MTKHPFISKSIKDYISGFDKGFDVENINDSLIMAANDIRGVLIPAELYDALIDSEIPIEETDPPADPPVEPPDNADQIAEALERLRFCMAPLAIYKHFIWLQLRVSNNGITTYKGQDETTAFKSQMDEAKESLMTRFGVFFKELIDYLEENIPDPAEEEPAEGETYENIFSYWANSDQKKELDALLIKSYRDFDNYFQTEGNAAFFIRSRIFQQEAFDEINAHIKIAPIIDAETKDEAKIRKLKKALAYLTISRAVFEWDISLLPLLVQRVIIGVNSKEYEETKRELSAKYQNYAYYILKGIDIQNEADKAETDSPDEPVSLTTPEVNKHDKHYLML
jgi:hypothetical protein